MKYAKVFGILLAAEMLLVSCGKMQDGADVSQSGIVWGNQWLVPVGTDSAAGGEVTLEDPHWTDEFLRVMAVNNGLRELRINVEEEVHVQLDGEWYAVPYLPGTVLGDTIVHFLRERRSRCTVIWKTITANFLREITALPCG